MSDFEDPTALARCIKSDCAKYRAGNTPFCPQHLREQEVAAGATSIVEPELEAKATAAGLAAIQDTYVGPDPDVNGLTPPPLETLEPHWDGKQYVLLPKRKGPDMATIASLVRELMAELDIHEEEIGHA